MIVLPVQDILGMCALGLPVMASLLASLLSLE